MRSDVASNTSSLRVKPWTSKRCFAGSSSGLPEWLVVMQIGGRDRPDQFAEGRFRIDRMAWIDVALPRTRLRKHREVNKRRSLGVPRAIGVHLARRRVGKRIGSRHCCNESTRNACRRACEETSVRKRSFSGFSTNKQPWSFKLMNTLSWFSRQTASNSARNSRTKKPSSSVDGSAVTAREPNRHVAAAIREECQSSIRTESLQRNGQGKAIVADRLRRSPPGA